MHKLRYILPALIVSLLLFNLPAGMVSALAADNSARVGANVSVPVAPPDFGYGVNFGNPRGWYNPGLATVAAAAGANSARIKLPEYHFARWGYDIEFANGDMAAYRSNGLTNLTGMLIGPTAAHSNSPTGGRLDQYSPKNLYQPIWSSPGVVNPNNYWANHVYQTVSRYKGYVKIWEVWNEPDNTPNWQLTQSSWWTSPPRPQDLPWWNDTIFAYIRMLRVTYEVAKAVDPSSFVAVGGLAYESFLDAILRYTDNPADGSVTAAYPARGGAWFDAVSYHHYPQYATYDQANQTWLRGTDSDAMATSFVAHKNTMQLQLDRWGYNGTTYPKKLWLVTETGVSSKPISGLAGGPELARNYLLKVPILAQANGVSQIDWYMLTDTEADSYASSPFAHMGLYYNLAGQTVATARMKPSGVAFDTFGTVTRGARFDAAATAALALPASARGYVFRLPDGRKIYALWAKTSGNSEAASATVQLPTGVPLQKRLWDSSATGATSLLTPTGGNVSITLTAAPLFLTETTSSGGSIILPPSPTATPPVATTTPTVPPATATPTVPPATATPTPTITPVPTISPAGQLLTNGGFESALASWFVPAWFSATASITSAVPHGGAKALQFKGNVMGPYTFQEVVARPGQKIDFSGWMNVTERYNDSTVAVELVARNSYNGVLATFPITTNSSMTAGWVPISGSAVMPARTAKVRLQIRFSRLHGTFLFDDLSLRGN
ncbi:MAG: hypothetical protein EPO21_11660 [Chloroflexota bacterium]|nr:MAG: hypothetical protein EPO21_11660 [Chloroflexota bacterium]